MMTDGPHGFNKRGRIAALSDQNRIEVDIIRSQTGTNNSLVSMNSGSLDRSPHRLM